MPAFAWGMRCCLQNARHQSTASAEVACCDIEDLIATLNALFWV